jgi:very-short-patch-repair endonuclease
LIIELDGPQHLEELAGRRDRMTSHALTAASHMAMASETE